MSEPVLDQIYEYCRYNAPVGGEDRELSFDGVLCVLLYRGLTVLLPDLHALQRKNAEMIKLQRVDIVNKLVDFAVQKGLNENVAFNCAGLIARCISKDNIGSIVSELQGLERKREESAESLQHNLEVSLQ